MRSYGDWLFQEALWNDVYAAAEASRKYPNHWIHFTNERKLGIHLKKSHKDPYGIYFYNTSWIIDEENHRGFQYAITNKYFYIVKIKPSPNAVYLSKMSLSEAQEIAKRNGWYDEFMAVYNDPKKYLIKAPTDRKLWSRKLPGAIFYATADLLANGHMPDVTSPDQSSQFLLGKKSWLQTLKGIDYIVDRSGIITQNEPIQAVVLNVKSIDIVYFGENKRNSIEFDIAKAVLEKLGGTSYFKNGKINGEFQYDKKPVKAIFDLPNNIIYLNYFVDNMRVDYPLRYNFVFADYPKEYDISGITSEISNHLKKEKLTKTGKELYWNYQKMLEIAKELNLGKASKRIYTGDNKYTMILDDTFFGGGFMGRLETNAADRLKIYLATYGRENDLEITRTITKPKNEKDEKAKIEKIKQEFFNSIRPRKSEDQA